VDKSLALRPTSRTLGASMHCVSSSSCCETPCQDGDLLVTSGTSEAEVRAPVLPCRRRTSGCQQADRPSRATYAVQHSGAYSSGSYGHHCEPRPCQTMRARSQCPHGRGAATRHGGCNAPRSKTGLQVECADLFGLWHSMLQLAILLEKLMNLRNFAR
jgi:hypothetical protein